jgi:hypothetical protein
VSESLKAQYLWFRVHVLPAETGLEQNPISWRRMHGKLEVNFSIATGRSRAHYVKSKFEAFVLLAHPEATKDSPNFKALFQ